MPSGARLGLHIGNNIARSCCRRLSGACVFNTLQLAAVLHMRNIVRSCAIVRGAVRPQLGPMAPCFAARLIASVRCIWFCDVYTRYYASASTLVCAQCVVAVYVRAASYRPCTAQHGFTSHRPGCNAASIADQHDNSMIHNLTTTGKGERSLRT